MFFVLVILRKTFAVDKAPKINRRDERTATPKRPQYLKEIPIPEAA
jgi:hypothetical protein